jgi:hypothetical protein
MNQSQAFAIVLITAGTAGLLLERQCKLQSTLVSIIGDPAQFGKFIIALVLFVIVVSYVPEPYSTYLVAMVLLSMVFIDVEKNGSSSLFSFLGG